MKNQTKRRKVDGNQSVMKDSNAQSKSSLKPKAIVSSNKYTKKVTFKIVKQNQIAPLIIEINKK